MMCFIVYCMECDKGHPGMLPMLILEQKKLSGTEQTKDIMGRGRWPYRTDHCGGLSWTGDMVVCSWSLFWVDLGAAMRTVTC